MLLKMFSALAIVLTIPFMAMASFEHLPTEYLAIYYERDAKQALKVGASKADVERYFQERGLTYGWDEWTHIYYGKRRTTKVSTVAINIYMDRDGRLTDIIVMGLYTSL